MPRLLPPEWIKLIARNCLLRLYENDPGFMQEWNDVKRPFTPILEQAASANLINEIEGLLIRNPPEDLITWVSDLQKLRNYVQALQSVSDLSHLRESYDSLLEQLAPYIQRLNELAYKWNLRATWAGNELMWQSIHKIQQDILEAAEVESFLDLLGLQIQNNINTGEGKLPSDVLPINILSIYLTGGRRGFTTKLNKTLKEFEQDLRVAGAIEPPSALQRHAGWWFDHHVYHVEFPEIANKIANIKSSGGPHPENIRKEVIKFSELIDIDPIERT